MPVKLTCYALNEDPPKLAPARPNRAWMDSFTDRHPYRCLPLSIANAHGWEVLAPVPIEVEWNGGPDVKDLKVRGLKPMPGGRPFEHFGRSNFSRGIVTFHTDYLFVTDPGWDLIATGSFNQPKDNAYPLTGIMESDWLPYPFTMNWQILRPGRVLFEEDEPFCFIFPIPKQALVETQPEIRRLSDNKELLAQHEAFRTSREEFMKKFHAGDEATLKQPWLRHYFVGRHPDGTKVGGHVNKLRLKEPVDLRPPLPPAELAPAPPAVELVPARRDPRWDDDSLLNEIPLEQGDLNYAGRARVDKQGLLTDASATYRINSAREAEGCDFFCVEEFLSADECALLRDAFHGLEDRLFKSEAIDPFWNNRFVWLADILAGRPEAGRLMLARQRRALALMSSFYRLKAPIYSDILQIVQWKPGMFMPPHADNVNPDGSPHGMAYRDLSSVAYLNDDYEGGELYFTALDIAIKPRRGMLVGFTAGFHHEHGVLRVAGGSTRLTIPSFFTFNPAKADPLIHPEVPQAAALA